MPVAISSHDESPSFALHSCLIGVAITPLNASICCHEFSESCLLLLCQQHIKTRVKSCICVISQGSPRLPVPDGSGQVNLPDGPVDLNKFFLLYSK